MIVRVRQKQSPRIRIIIKDKYNLNWKVMNYVFVVEWFWPFKLFKCTSLNALISIQTYLYIT